MPEVLHPGVYIEEVPMKARPIEGVPTSTAAFVGAAAAPHDPVLLTSFVEFERALGATIGGFLPEAVRGFFDNGGERCLVALGGGPAGIADALAALEKSDFSLLCCPDEDDFDDVAATLATFCERRQNVLAIVQPRPPLSLTDHPPGPRSSYLVRYYPRLVIRPLNASGNITIPPGGHVAGAYARLDRERGVHVSPDGIRLTSVIDVSEAIDANAADSLVARGVNVIRHVQGRGIRLFGGRTASDDPDVGYVAVRRLLVLIEESIRRGMRWVMFERNDPALWTNVVRVIQDYLTPQWRAGMLVGATPDTAFFVRCDRTTMTQEDVDAGRVVAVVGIAPLRPAEFVIFRITVQTSSDDDD